MNAPIEAAGHPVLVLAPIGRDAPLTQEALANAGIPSRICVSTHELVRRLDEGAGAALVTEEALRPETARDLFEALREQPAWSDLPLIVLTSGLAGGVARRLLDALGPGSNVALLERPVGRITLVAAARTALRARSRQYEVRKLLEREQGARALAEAESRAKDEFLAMLSHELRNPLAPIRNAAALLHRVAPQEERLARLRDIIDGQVSHMTRLLDDLLDVSRITTGKITLVRAPLRLGDAVRNAVDTVRPLVLAKQQTLDVDVADDVWIDGDAVRLIQVVTNLLHNAHKYTPDGGAIAVRLGRDGDDAVLTVRDSGVGIAADALERIFELFVQEDVPLDRPNGGLGLGLTLVRRLVDMHGGRVTAASAARGAGSEFVVRLPTVPPPAVAAPERAAPRAPAAVDGHPLILLVEDNLDSAESLALYLSLSGYRVDVAHDGAAALRRAGTSPPRAALVDIGLPGIDGLEVGRRLRAEAGCADALLIALTGYGRPEDRQRALAAGFDAHLVKPVDFDALHALLDRLAAPAPPPSHGH